MDGDYLEQFAHFIGRSQPMQGNGDIAGSMRMSGRERVRTRLDAKRPEPIALTNDAGNLRARFTRRAVDRLEIHVRSQILVPRMLKHRAIAVALDGLKRLSWRSSLMAVVDDECDTALRDKVTGDSSHGLVTCGRRLDDLPIAIEREMDANALDMALDPTDMLAHGQSVQELVGDNQRRRIGQSLDRLVPLRVWQRHLLNFG